MPSWLGSVKDVLNKPDPMEEGERERVVPLGKVTVMLNTTPAGPTGPPLRVVRA